MEAVVPPGPDEKTAMNHINARWFGLVLAIPLFAAGCAHRGDRTTGPVEAADAHPHAMHGDHAMHGSKGPHDAHAAHDAHEPSAAIPTDRWPADAPLVRGMSRIRTATDALVHASHGHLDAAQVRALAAELKSAVETMFVECRLEPAPDAALHPLLARVLAASQALSEGNFDAEALAELRAVLARYAELFEDTSADQIDSA